MAEPWVNTTKPPNKAIMIIIGNNQNFLRILRNVQSSSIKLNVIYPKIIIVKIAWSSILALVLVVYVQSNSSLPHDQNLRVSGACQLIS